MDVCLNTRPSVHGLIGLAITYRRSVVGFRGIHAVSHLAQEVAFYPFQRGQGTENYVRGSGRTSGE